MNDLRREQNKAGFLVGLTLTGEPLGAKFAPTTKRHPIDRCRGSHGFSLPPMIQTGNRCGQWRTGRGAAGNLAKCQDYGCTRSVARPIHFKSLYTRYRQRIEVR